MRFSPKTNKADADTRWAGRGGPWLTLLCLAALLAATLFAQSPAPTGDQWTDERVTQFLQQAKIGRSRSLSEGITNASRVELSDGQHTHEAQIQQVDISKTHYQTAMGWELNFRDSYKFNIAAYRLSRMLDLDNVPVSVERRVQGKTGAMTWWLDDVLMTEKERFLTKVKPPNNAIWNQQIYRIRVFDELIYNTDRNLGNLVITKNWKIWMIDHTRAFRTHKELRQPKQLVKCDRDFLEAMRKLDAERVSRELRDFLRESEIEALLARRDLIVEWFDRRAQQRGEQLVLYNYIGP